MDYHNDCARGVISPPRGLVPAIALACLLQTGRLCAEGDGAAPASPYPRVDVRADCGAAGDGITNDTEAFQKAAALIQEAGGGTLVI
ncbi:MAG: hypothetical protein GYA33_15895, partial [Thermogutta sp.]|nr:hypothetical protein [Thermogutta sp.]